MLLHDMTIHIMVHAVMACEKENLWINVGEQG